MERKPDTAVLSTPAWNVDRPVRSARSRQTKSCSMWNAAHCLRDGSSALKPEDSRGGEAGDGRCPEPSDGQRQIVAWIRDLTILRYISTY